MNPIQGKAIWVSVGTAAVLAACSVVSTPPPQAAPPPPLPPAEPEATGLARDPVPRGSPANWINTNDYPSRALREEREGRAQFRLTVGPDGRVAECSIVSSSGHPDLDTATCSILTRRARFYPALDAEGTPTSGTYSNHLTWRIDGIVREPLPLAGSVTTNMFVNRFGVIGHCQITRSSGELAVRNPVGPRYCRSVYTGMPFTDRRGRPVSRTIVTRREVRIRTVAEDFVPRVAGEATLPQRTSVFPETGRIVRAYIVETDGRQTNCQIVSVSGDMADNTRAGTYRCPIDRFVGPFMDSSGRPERRQVVETERVSVVRRR